ncbi:MAG: GTP-binding protein [Actinomycetota bacterium]
MADEETVPVVVIGGSGAQRLVDEVVTPDDCVLADDWYGPGSVRIGSDVAHRCSGCPCCAVRLDVVDGLLRAVRQARRPARALLVAGPGDDIATIGYSVLSDHDLARHVHLGAVVMVIDAVATTTRLASDAPLGPPGELDALAMADLIVLTRTGEVTEAARRRLDAELRGVSALGLVVSLDGESNGRNPTLPIRRALIRPDAWRGVPAVERSGPTGLACAATDGPQTVILRETTPLDPDAVDAWLDRLVDTNPLALLRVQAAIAVESTPARVLCHGVRSFAVSQGQTTGSGADRHESRVVIVGRGLDVDELIRDFAATRTR